MEYGKLSKGLLIATACIFLCSSSFAQTPQKEEKFWKSKAKAYTKNPLSLKRDFETYQNQIAELKEQITQMQNDKSSSRDQVVSCKNQLDSLKWENIQIKGEKQAIQKKIDKMELALKSEKKSNDAGVKTGLVYRTQVGAFSQYEMKNKPVKAEDFLEEKVDGLNKYMLGNFRTQPEADAFALELKKVGIKDAWVVPYIDGIRVTFAEAESYMQKQGTGATLPQISNQKSTNGK